MEKKIDPVLFHFQFFVILKDGEKIDDIGCGYYAGSGEH